MAIDFAPLLDTTTEEQIIPYDETEDDPNRRTHIVNPPDNPHISGVFPDMEAQEVVNIARANRVEITALCGHKFIPAYNPEEYDICQPCMDIAGMIMRESGE